MECACRPPSIVAFSGRSTVQRFGEAIEKVACQTKIEPDPQDYDDAIITES